MKQSLFRAIKTFRYYPRYSILKLIRFYQKTVSFDHGLLKNLFPDGFCRFHPSCSEYGYRAIEKYGIIRGGLKALWRVMRCNPFSKGGFDPVDKNEKKYEHKY